jgi:surface protein, putative
MNRKRKRSLFGFVNDFYKGDNMKKKDILLGAGLTTIFVGAGAVNTTAHAEEVDSGQPKPTVKTTPVHVTEQDVKNAKADVDKAQLMST